MLNDLSKDLWWAVGINIYNRRYRFIDFGDTTGSIRIKSLQWLVRGPYSERSQWSHLVKRLVSRSKLCKSSKSVREKGTIEKFFEEQGIGLSLYVI